MGRGTLEKLDAIRRGEISAVENVQQALERIKKQDKRVKAFIELNPHALAEAEAIDCKLKRDERVGKLAGLAIGVKSNLNVTGLRATCASRTLEDYVSTPSVPPITLPPRGTSQGARAVVVGLQSLRASATSALGRIREVQFATQPATAAWSGSSPLMGWSRGRG